MFNHLSRATCVALDRSAAKGHAVNPMFVGVNMSYVQIVSPLVLHADPVIPNHAVTKRYVDAKKTAAHATWFTSGVLPVGRLPALTGDIASAQGSGVATLSVNGVTAGSYPKVTVDSAGRVIAGSALSGNDIPNVSWTKITTGKPTTTAGYGITNLLAVSGGTVTGPITSTATPSANLDAVTKGYVDNAVTGVTSGTLSVGDIVRKPTAVAPTGFLRCNGGYVDRTVYPDLFNTVGHNLLTKATVDYTSYTVMGAGQPWLQQYDFNTATNTDITNWVTGTFIGVGAPDCNLVVTKNRVYLLGVGGVSSIRTAPINSDGTIGSWVQNGDTGWTGRDSEVIVTKNRIYLIGGYDVNGGVSSIRTAPINSDGTFGVWTTAATFLTTNTFRGAIFATKNRVYLVGGVSTGSGTISTVQSAPINSDGTIGSWSGVMNGLPASMSECKAFVTKNRVYLLGGVDGAGNKLSTVYTAPINSDGTIGSWSTGATLPGTVTDHHVLTTKNAVFVIPGYYNGTSYAGVILKADINSDGTIGSWVQLTTGRVTRTMSSKYFVTKGKLHQIGGITTGSAVQGYVVTADFSGGLSDYSRLYDGTINKFDGSNLYGSYVVEELATDTTYVQPGAGKPWQQQYEINTAQSADITAWSTTTPLPAVMYEPQAVVTKNRVYLLGEQSYSAPVNTDGSLGTWSAVTLSISNVRGAQAVVTKNRVHLLGGYNGVNKLSTDLTAIINSDGTLGTFTGIYSLPVGLSNSQSIVTKNRIYLIGGVVATAEGETYTASVYTAPINSDGTLGSWTTGSSLPQPVSRSQAVVTKNRVYLMAGLDLPTGPMDVVYTAPINSDGTLGSWATSSSLPTKFAYSQSIVTNNRVYLLGGYFNGSNSPVVYTAPINSDGTLGSWTTGTSLPNSFNLGLSLITKGKIYLLGGQVNGSMSTSVYTANISGGLNDYSPYYDGTVVPIDPNTSFKLPDFTLAETNNINYYIKY